MSNGIPNSALNQAAFAMRNSFTSTFHSDKIEDKFSVQRKREKLVILPKLQYYKSDARSSFTEHLDYTSERVAKTNSYSARIKLSAEN